MGSGDFIFSEHRFYLAGDTYSSIANVRRKSCECLMADQDYVGYL